MKLPNEKNILGMSSRLNTIQSESQIESHGTSSQLSTFRAIHDQIIFVEKKKPKLKSVDLKIEVDEYTNAVSSFMNSLSPSSQKKMVNKNDALSSPKKDKRAQMEKRKGISIFCDDNIPQEVRP